MVHILDLLHVDVVVQKLVSVIESCQLDQIEKSTVFQVKLAVQDQLKGYYPNKVHQKSFLHIGKSDLFMVFRGNLFLLNRAFNEKLED